MLFIINKPTGMFLFSQPNRWDTLLLACSHHVATKLFSVEICLVKENYIPSSPHLGISAQKTQVKNLVISRNNALDIHEYTHIFMPTNLT